MGELSWRLRGESLSRRGLQLTGLNVSMRLREVKTETCSADLAAGRVLVT